MKILLFGALILGIIGQTFAQTDTISGDYQLRGVAKDQIGAVFPNLTFYIRKGDYSRTFNTDINGKFEISLRPGEYEITVNKLYSRTFKAFIRILDGSLNPNDLVFVLDSSQDCCSTTGGIPCPNPVNLSMPLYPPVARAVRASGEVTVAVKIAGDGSVTEAVSENGHPLLRRAAELAAKESRFELSKTDSVRDTKLTYIFIPSEKGTLDLKRHLNPCLIEIYSHIQVVDTIDY